MKITLYFAENNNEVTKTYTILKSSAVLFSVSTGFQFKFPIDKMILTCVIRKLSLNLEGK